VHDERVVAAPFDDPVDIPHVGAAPAALAALTGYGDPLLRATGIFIVRYSSP